MADYGPISFPCHTCGSRLNAKPGQGGRQFTCPKCQAIVLVPSADDGAREEPARVDGLLFLGV